MPVAVGVMLAEQVADAPVPANVQVPLGRKLTVPLGVIAVPGEVSLTVAVQLVAWLTKTGDGTHATDVVVVLVVTVTVVLPLLAA